MNPPRTFTLNRGFARYPIRATDEQFLAAWMQTLGVSPQTARWLACAAWMVGWGTSGLVTLTEQVDVWAEPRWESP